ncbi:MAG TPA: class I SAM-dependent methyltransferase [Syntrophales bacterium]|nr:class I SAM-dependent methyltransferase [Syntrophales bacterium]
MTEKQEILERAQKASLLDSRIDRNVSGQQLDLVQWIFNQLEIGQGSRILELCSGTGSQTLQLLHQADSTGHVVAMDISKEAIETLVSKLTPEQQQRSTFILSNIDDLAHSLNRVGLKPAHFDLIFCAYGLYYSNNALLVMQTAKSWLRAQGRIVIVGPFGTNNAPLFDLLKSGGVEIPCYVTYTSSDFMFKEVIPWAAQHFDKITINTVVNKITWQSSADVLYYWRNTTFYDEAKLPAIEKLLEQHFARQDKFINEKWIMMVESSNAKQ